MQEFRRHYFQDLKLVFSSFAELEHPGVARVSHTSLSLALEQQLRLANFGDGYMP